MLSLFLMPLPQYNAWKIRNVFFMFLKNSNNVVKREVKLNFHRFLTSYFSRFCFLKSNQSLETSLTGISMTSNYFIGSQSSYCSSAAMEARHHQITWDVRALGAQFYSDFNMTLICPLFRLDMSTQQEVVSPPRATLTGDKRRFLRTNHCSQGTQRVAIASTVHIFIRIMFTWNY